MGKTELVRGLAVEGKPAAGVQTAAAVFYRFAAAPDGAMNPADLIALQRMAGNRVIQRTQVGERPNAPVISHARGTVQGDGTGIAKGETWRLAGRW